MGRMSAAFLISMKGGLATGIGLPSGPSFGVAILGAIMVLVGVFWARSMGIHTLD